MYRSPRKFLFAVLPLFFAFLALTSLLSSFAFAETSIGWKGTKVRYTGSTWGHPPEPSLITFTRFDNALAWTNIEAATPRLNNTTGTSWIVSTDLVERFQTVKDGLITRYFSDNHPYTITQIAPGASLWWGLCSDGWERGKREARISYLHTIYGPYSQIPPETKAFALLNNCSYQSPPQQDFIGVLPLLEVYQVVSEKNLGCNEKLKGNPCDVTTGNKYHSETDYQSPDGQLSFVRTYNSGLGNDQGLGIAWTSSLTPKLEILPTNRVLVVREADGRGEPWIKSGSFWFSDSDTQISLAETVSGFTLTRRNGDMEFYNGDGLLTSKTSASGQTTTYTRTSTQMVVTGPTGHSLTFSYNGDHISGITDSSGRTISYSYDVNDNLVRVSYPNSTAKIYHYENPSLLHHLTGISYATGSGNPVRFATYAYNNTGKVESTEHTGGQQKFAFSYYEGMTHVADGAGNKEAFSFEMKLGVLNLHTKTNFTDNKTLTQTFDPNNNLTCKKDEEGRVTTYTYNSTFQKVSETTGQTGTCSSPVATPATRATTYQYLSPTLDLPTLTESPSVFGTSKKRVVVGYTNNLPTTITQSGFTPSGAAVSRAVTLTYNTLGQVKTIDGPRTDVEDVTTLTYNECTTGGGCGQLQRVTNALGQVTSYDSYDANGRLLQMTDPNGLRTVYTYDARGRVATLTQTAPGGGGSRVTSYGYDTAGNILTTTLPTGLVLTYTYDAALNLRRVLDSLGNYIDYGYDLKGNRTQTYTYDASGTLVRTVDLAFNARNRVSQLTAGGSITKQVWDAVGNLTAVTDPNTVASAGTAATNNNSYDALNRLLTSVDLLSGVTQYGYDPNDRLKTVQAPNGSVTTYQYDDLGNLLREISPDRGTISYAYDAAGNLITQTDARGITVGYVYDALNRLTRMDYPGTVEDVTYVYDTLPTNNCTLGMGRLCHVTDAGGSSVYGYDGFGNLASERRTELGVIYTTRYAYDAGNRITSMTYPNGRVVDYTRNLKGDIQATSMTLNGVTTSLLTARYRPDGLPLTLNFGNNLTDTRSYDTQGRLTYQSIGTADTRLYTYDANSNLTKLQSLPQVGAYTYDVLDRLKQEDRTTQGTVSTTWTYDLNGNRRTENTGTYAYLANSNRLQATPAGAIVLDAAGNTLSEGSRSYTYNNAGHLSQVNDAGYSYNAKRQRSRKVVGSQATVFHYDLAGNLLAETDVNGNLIRDYVWVGAIPIAQVEAGEQVRYLHGDHLNTPRLATNASGVKVWGWEGEACGATQPTGSVTINLRFPGQYWDAESGLHQNWNRYYDPKLCRYVTSDPIGLKGGLNTYAYVGNNPLRYTDPTGLASEVLLPACALGPNPVCITGVVVTACKILVIGAGAVLMSSSTGQCGPDKQCKKDDDDRCRKRQQEEEGRCWDNYGSVFGPGHFSYRGCMQRAATRADLCRRGLPEPPEWSDSDVTGEPPLPGPPRERK